MSEYMNKCGKEIILPCRRIKDNLHRHSGEEEVEYCCPHCKVWAVHSDVLLKRAFWKGEGEEFQWKNLTDVTSAKLSRLISIGTSHDDSMCP